MRVSNNIAGIVLTVKEKECLRFALVTLRQDVGTRGEPALDKKAQQAYKLAKEIAFRLGVE